MKWIKFGWGDSFLPSPLKSTDKFHVEFPPTNNTTLERSIVEVANEVIKKISHSYPSPYNLFVSGGVDSQTMLWLWKRSGVPFNAISIVYENPNGVTPLNEHDLVQLKEFATIHDIPITYKEFDLINFLEHELPQYAIRYQCTSPQICTHMKMSECCDQGTVIFSGNFKDYAPYTYTILGMKRYADMSERNVIPFFLLHDETLASYTSGISVKPREHLSEIVNDWVYTSKIEILHKIGIPVIRQKTKYNGFEKVKEYYDEQDSKYSLVTPLDRLKFVDQPSKRAFDILFRYRLTNLVKYQDQVIYINNMSRI